MAQVLNHIKNAVNAIRKPGSPEPVVWSGKRPGDIPSHRIRQPILKIRARSTGPEDGLCGMHRDDAEKRQCKHCQPSWYENGETAYGMALSLYDKAAKDRRVVNNGDPVADVFGVVSYKNGSLLCVADGVNWGEKSRLAARCAVHGSLEYLERSVEKATSTQEIVAHLLRSFDAAQKLIIQRQATMTTLCTACIFQVEDGRWALCVVIVGDSLMFVYSPSTGNVREVTGAAHPCEKRDLREAGGALGPSDGYNPDLGNLTCAFTFLEQGDVVFGTTDGVSDNFDPVVAQVGRAAATAAEKSKLTAVPMEERTAGIQARMAKALKEEMPSGKIEHAEGLVVALLSHCVSQTDAKRRVLEEANELQDDPDEEHKLVMRSHGLPGKLDHAAVVAVDVCFHHPSLSPTMARRQEEVAQEVGTL